MLKTLLERRMVRITGRKEVVGSPTTITYRATDVAGNTTEIPIGPFARVGDEREVDGHVHAESESADGHSDQEAVEVAGDGDGEHRQAVHDRRGDDEDLPPAGAVGEPAAGAG